MWDSDSCADSSATWADVGQTIKPRIILLDPPRQIVLPGVDLVSAFADVPSEQTSAANTLANVVQQLTLGFGVAAAAAAVHLAALLHHDAAMGPTLTDFRTAIMAAAIMAAVSTLDALALSPDAGSLVSGHRPLRSERENDLANSKA
jgi:hypothetical protein